MIELIELKLYSVPDSYYGDCLNSPAWLSINMRVFCLGFLESMLNSIDFLKINVVKNIYNKFSKIILMN